MTLDKIILNKINAQQLVVPNYVDSYIDFTHNNQKLSICLESRAG